MDNNEALLVKKIAANIFNRYCPKGGTGQYSRDDLLHYGIIGLLKAKRNFNKDMNVPFNAYAAIRIRGEIMDAIRKSPMVRLPQEKRQQYNILAKARDEFLNNGIQPSQKDLADRLGWDEKTVIRVEAQCARVTAVEDRPDYMELAGSSQAGDPEKNALQKDLAGIMQHCLEALEDTTLRLILIAREVKQMKLKQLAEQFGWSIEKVRQKQFLARDKMKQCLEKHGWDLT